MLSSALLQTSGSAARHPSLYLALRARPWIRISQSYDVDMSDVDTTLTLFAAATASSTTESWQWVSWNSSSSVVDLPACRVPSRLCSLLLSSTAAETPATELLRSSVSHARQFTFAPRTPAPPRKQLSHTPARALVGYGGMYAGRGQRSSTTSDDGAA